MAPYSVIRSALAAALVLTVSACDTWLGEKEAPPLPGDRISVLLNERSLSADPTLAGHKILLPRPTRNAAWPQEGGYANHAMHHIEVSDAIKPVWERDIGQGLDDEERLTSQPVVAAGMVYVMDAANTVTALRTDNGNKVWSIDLTQDEEDDDFFGGGVAYDKGSVFISTGFGEVFALNAKTGHQIWRKSVQGTMRAAPTIRGNRVFVTTADNKLFALSAFTGEELWNYEGIFEMAGMLGSGSPAVDKGVVVVTFSSGEVVALKVENGRQVWSDSLATVRRSEGASNLADIRGRPVIDRDRVFAVSQSGLMVAIDLRTGRRIWANDVASLESPWVVGNYIYVLTTDSELICLSRKDGKIYWVKGLPRYEDMEDQEDRIIWTGPVLTSDRLLVAGSHGRALAVSPYNGRLLGYVEMPDGVTIPPVIADRSVYFLANDATLVSFK
ncbi:MAG: PQQ-binding-like beta-propeller repeat protein [Alphaproteobacteria bacterium]|nr:PQQ-binding-like beta-propeller repeat protein [Rhodospirillales bacterium]MCW9045353.1 PQQ-binding-like beta-propeller repeat protein [Alphaproteobacteria bacterium]